MEGHGEATPATTARAKPARTSWSVTQPLSSEQGAVVPQRLRDLARRRDQERLDVERVGDHVEARGQLPQPEQDGDDHDRREPAPHREPLDSASRARSRAAVNSGAVTVSSARPGSRRWSGELADRSSRPRPEHDHPVGEVERLLDVVGDQDHGPRLGRQRLGQPLLHLGAGDRVERGERLVQQQHGLAGEQRAEERDPLAHAAGQLRRPRALEAGEPEALEQGVGLAPRDAARGAPVPQRERGVVDRREPGQEQVALRHVGAAAQASRRRAPRRRPRSRPRVGSRRPLTSSSRVDLPQPDGPTMPSTSPGLTRRSSRRSPRARRRSGRGQRPRPRVRSCRWPVRRGRPRRARPPPRRSSQPIEAPLREPRKSFACSLRAHYRTGSKGQRRVVSARGAISAR